MLSLEQIAHIAHLARLELRLTLQALLHVPAYAGVWDGTLGALALAAMAGTMALAVLCFVKVIGLVLLGRRIGPTLYTRAEFSKRVKAR